MIRLDRYLVLLGEGSRSQVQKCIRAGQVMVNGQLQKDPSTLLPEEGTALTLSGRALDTRLTRHLMLHKPAGLLTAARDKKQPTVMDLVPSVCQTLSCMPVGRLDKDTTGLLLLTTDGELNHRLLSPQRHVDKTYRAVVEGTLTADLIPRFAQGIPLEDFTALPATLVIEEAGAEISTASLTIREGKFHQVKRMFSAVGHEVLQLHRLTFGALSLDPQLQPGQWRDLTPDETAALYRQAGLEDT